MAGTGARTQKGSPYAFLFFDVKNARPYYKEELKDPKQLGFHALDNHTLVVELERPIAYFLQVMAFSISLPQREDLIEKHGEAFTEAGNYVTNGPYILDTWDHENQIILKPKPATGRAHPKTAASKCI